MVIVNPETKGPLGDSHLGEVSAGFAPWGSFPVAPWAFLFWETVWSCDTALFKMNYCWSFQNLGIISLSSLKKTHLKRSLFHPKSCKLSPKHYNLHFGLLTLITHQYIGLC